MRKVLQMLFGVGSECRDTYHYDYLKVMKIVNETTIATNERKDLIYRLICNYNKVHYPDYEERNEQGYNTYKLFKALRNKVTR